MKFAHLADTHLGYRQYGLIEREEDFYNVFEDIVDKIIEERVDFVIHSGDLFEIAKPSPNALLAFQEEFLRIKDAGIPFYAIAGNHDSIMRKNALPPIILFKKLGLNIISPNNPVIESSFLRENGIFVGGTPYISKSQNNLLKLKLEELSKLSKDYSKRILVAHQGIDKYLRFQYELELADIPTNFNYYAMGHIHNRIVDDFGEGKLVYPGSSEIWRANELNDYKKNGKGFYIVDISSSGSSFGENLEVEPINIDLPREFISENIEFNNLDSDILSLEKYINQLNKQPILNINIETKEKDKINSGDIYKKLNDAFSNNCLMVRPSFITEETKNEEKFIFSDDSLGHRELLKEYLKITFNNEDICNLALDLLDNLSKDKDEEAKKISDNFYHDYFGESEKLGEKHDI